jgi:hypothetical protein
MTIFFCQRDKQQQKRTMKKIVIMILTLVALTFGAQAQEQNESTRSDARQVRQRARIVEGRVDGDLTRAERKAINKQQRHIRRVENRAKS